jgi:hypothetical protein
MWQLYTAKLSVVRVTYAAEEIVGAPATAPHATSATASHVASSARVAPAIASDVRPYVPSSAALVALPGPLLPRPHAMTRPHYTPKQGPVGPLPSAQRMPAGKMPPPPMALPGVAPGALAVPTAVGSILDVRKRGSNTRDSVTPPVSGGRAKLHPTTSDEDDDDNGDDAPPGVEAIDSETNQEQSGKKQETMHKRVPVESRHVAAGNPAAAAAAAAVPAYLPPPGPGVVLPARAPYVAPVEAPATEKTEATGPGFAAAADARMIDSEGAGAPAAAPEKATAAAQEATVSKAASPQAGRICASIHVSSFYRIRE